jgi:hypothetical protein
VVPWMQARCCPLPMSAALSVAVRWKPYEETPTTSTMGAQLHPNYAADEGTPDRCTWSAATGGSA